MLLNYLAATLAQSVPQLQSILKLTSLEQLELPSFLLQQWFMMRRELAGDFLFSTGAAENTLGKI